MLRVDSACHHIWSHLFSVCSGKVTETRELGKGWAGRDYKRGVQVSLQARQGEKPNFKKNSPHLRTDKKKAQKYLLKLKFNFNNFNRICIPLLSLYTCIYDKRWISYTCLSKFFNLGTNACIYVMDYGAGPFTAWIPCPQDVISFWKNVFLRMRVQ